MRLRQFGRVAAFAVVVAGGRGALASDGRIIAIGDEWLLSDLAFVQLGTQSGQLATNVAGFFSAGPGADFAVFTNSPIAFGTSLQSHMTGLGHTWNTNPGTFSLATLMQYDGVFLAGAPGSGVANAGVLSQYVQSGGNVFVMAGTGAFGDAASEAAAWDPFLNQFGLGFGQAWFGPNGTTQVPANPSSHPLGSAITTLLWGLGQTAMDLDPQSALNEVALFGDFTGVDNPPSGNVASQPVIATYNVPTPGTAALLGLGGVFAARRRR